MLAERAFSPIYYQRDCHCQTGLLNNNLFGIGTTFARIQQLPPANGVVKVMFSVVCVRLSVHPGGGDHTPCSTWTSLYRDTPQTCSKAGCWYSTEMPSYIGDIVRPKLTNPMSIPWLSKSSNALLFGFFLRGLPSSRSLTSRWSFLDSKALIRSLTETSLF